MKKIFKEVVRLFLPTYEVVCTNYQIIPGYPVNKNESKHKFKKGASGEAIEFYWKVVSSDLTKKMAPVEVHLRKGGKTIQKTHFGPVDNFKKPRKTAFKLPLYRPA